MHLIMNDYISNLEKDFQPYLPTDHYTFIGPANQDYLGDFTSIVNLVAPTHNASRNINYALANKNAVKQVINTMYQDAELDVYVVEGGISNGIVYTTIAEYCQRFHIRFRQLSS